mmetsp:Transcript_24053/g.29615  ORF Transcript_24053/g.29615 Transcript_24053/m.29615 type:complete len:333 (+) Transcript_24053:1561-2559(+)
MSSPHAVPSGSQSQNILLDSSIRDWVVLPILFIMIQTGLLRFYLQNVLKSAKGKNVPKVEHRVKNACFRASKLRSGNAAYLSKSKWEARRMYWTDSDEGYLKEELQWIVEEKEREAEEKATNADGSNTDADIDMPDPMAMMGNMKGQAVFMVQNMVMMQGIGFFFQGYLLLKVPFPLTMGFKMMFQKGLDLTTLETSYVSSVSWYFLVTYGLRAFFRLVIEGNNQGGMSQEQMEAARMQTDFGITMNTMPSKFNPNVIIKSEQENLDIMRHKSTVDDAESRLLGKKYSKKKLGGAVDGNSGEPGYDIFGAYPTPAASSSKKTKKKQSKVKAT